MLMMSLVTLEVLIKSTSTTTELGWR